MGKRILVADDSRTIQQAFAMVMDGSGYTLSFAKSVDEALAAAKRDGRPDLLLSDAALGTGSGYDLCAQFKAEPGLRDVPVFILASAQNPYDESRGRKVGADGHLAKPFESQALLDAVASALSTPTHRPAAVMPADAIDGGSTSRYSEEEAGSADDDSYGEITIERGPTGAPAPAPSAWAARPPTKPSPSGARPLPTAPTPAPAAHAPRPPMIPPPRVPTGVPATASGMPTHPAGVPSLPTPPQSRLPARTMMGFPAPKPGASARPTGFPIPGSPSALGPSAPVPSRPATMPPASAPVRVPSFPSPAAPVVPAAAKPATANPSLPLPTPAPRSMPGRFAPTPPTPAAASPAPATRRTMTPLPQAATAGIAGALAAAADKIDQKVAAIAERGPQYEAIAKLSREIIEQVVWEVVPELAETIIRQEIDRLASAKK